MEKTLFSAVYNRKKKLLSNGTALVQIEAYLRGKKKYFTTGIYLTPDQWDNKHRKVRDHMNAIRLNKQITDFMAKLENVELKQLNAGKPFSLDQLTEFMNGQLTSSFLDFMDRELKGSQLAPGTKAGQRVILGVLRGFRKELLFDEVSYEFLTSFEKYLYGRKLAINTVNRYFKVIRKYVNLAINKDFMELNRYPFRKFRAKTESTQRKYLTPEELQRIENITLSPEHKHLQKVVDMFLFSCYTGLRFSDVSAISKNDIITNDGRQWIIMRMQKTNEMIHIPLSLLFDGKPIEILNRYIQPDRKFIFDDLTNQYVNRCMKEVATLANIQKIVTFHSARH